MTICRNQSGVFRIADALISACAGDRGFRGWFPSWEPSQSLSFLYNGYATAPNMIFAVL